MEGKQTKTFAEILARYKRGERDFTDLELENDPDADLSGVCPDGADLSRSYIVASFHSASLRGIRFVGANVKTCDFRCADLRDADFSGAALCATRFTGARMEGARFTGAYYHNRELRDGEQPDW